AHLQASKAEERRQENTQLQQELKLRLVAEANLLETQGRLLEQLECAPEAILCIKEDKKVKFANEAASRLFKRSHEQLLRSSADDFIAPKYLHIDQPRYCGDIDIFVEDTRQSISSDILSLPEGSGLRTMYIFNVGGG
ncbi:PAS domain-containing protein, partial [Vibrio campbellii]